MSRLAFLTLASFALALNVQASAQPIDESRETMRLERIAALEAAGRSAFPEYLEAVSQLSTDYANQSRYAEALPLLRRAHRAAEQHLGPQHPTTNELRATILLMQPFIPGSPTHEEADSSR